MRLEFTVTETDHREWVAEAKQEIDHLRMRVWSGKGNSPEAALADAIYIGAEFGWIKRSLQ